MAAKICVLGLKLSSYPYLKSTMVRFPLLRTILRSSQTMKDDNIDDTNNGNMVDEDNIDCDA